MTMIVRDDSFFSIEGNRRSYDITDSSDLKAYIKDEHIEMQSANGHLYHIDRKRGGIILFPNGRRDDAVFVAIYATNSRHRNSNGQIETKSFTHEQLTRVARIYLEAVNLIEDSGKDATFAVLNPNLGQVRLYSGTNVTRKRTNGTHLDVSSDLMKAMMKWVLPESGQNPEGEKTAPAAPAPSKHKKRKHRDEIDGSDNEHSAYKRARSNSLNETESSSTDVEEEEEEENRYVDTDERMQNTNMPPLNS